MRTPLNDAGIYFLGFFIAAIFVAALVFFLLRLDRKALEAKKKLDRHDPPKSAPNPLAPDISGGRDVSAALGVQQSTGLKIGNRPDEEAPSSREVF